MLLKREVVRVRQIGVTEERDGGRIGAHPITTTTLPAPFTGSAK